MYRSVDEIKTYLAQKDIYRPFILCEYVHAMGNSVGGLKEYWDVSKIINGTRRLRVGLGRPVKPVR